jgi:hypothetical protein
MDASAIMVPALSPCSLTYSLTHSLVICWYYRHTMLTLLPCMEVCTTTPLLTTLPEPCTRFTTGTLASTWGPFPKWPTPTMLLET